MFQHRFLMLVLAAISCAAAAAPMMVDASTPEPSAWLTVGCAVLLLTTMQRRP